MNKEYVLVISSQILQNPSLIGCANKDLQDDIFRVFTNGKSLRDYISNDTRQFEVWIIDSDDIEPINLAAAIKKDRTDIYVCLVSFSISGSLKNRSDKANVDKIFTRKSFNESFIRVKQENKNIKINQIATPEYRSKTDSTQDICDNSQSSNAYVLSVLSASGGSGKSSVATMLATLSHSAGLNTLLLDADLQLGDCAEKLGINNAVSIDTLYSDFNMINKTKTDVQKPSLISSLNHPEYSDKIIEGFGAFLKKLTPMYDVIVINTGNYWSELQASIIESDCNSIFLVDQRPSSINATKKVLDLCSRCGIATSSVKFAINKCSKKSLFSSIDVSCALQGVNVVELLDGGFDVEECMSTGDCLSLINSKNPFAISLWSMLESLLPKQLLEKIYSPGQHIENASAPKHLEVQKQSFKLFKRKGA